MVVAVVAEIVAQRRWDVFGIGTTAATAILHIDRDAAVMQELSDVEDFVLSAGGIQGQRHQLEMVFGSAEISGLLWIP